MEAAWQPRMKFWKSVTQRLTLTAVSLHVTRVVVTQGEPDIDGYEQWTVEWTWRPIGRDEDARHVHDSKGAAQRHVAGLLADIAPGLTKDEVLTVKLRD